MPVNHFSICVPTASVSELAAWLITSLQHMGFKEFMRPVPWAVGMGETTPYFWIYGVDAEAGAAASSYADILKANHVAFTAQS